MYNRWTCSALGNGYSLVFSRSNMFDFLQLFFMKCCVVNIDTFRCICISCSSKGRTDFFRCIWQVRCLALIHQHCWKSPFPSILPALFSETFAAILAAAEKSMRVRRKGAVVFQPLKRSPVCQRQPYPSSPPVVPCITLVPLGLPYCWTKASSSLWLHIQMHDFQPWSR